MWNFYFYVLRNFNAEFVFLRVVFYILSLIRNQNLNFQSSTLYRSDLVLNITSDEKCFDAKIEMLVFKEGQIHQM